MLLLQQGKTNIQLRSTPAQHRQLIKVTGDGKQCLLARLIFITYTSASLFKGHEGEGSWEGCLNFFLKFHFPEELTPVKFIKGEGKMVVSGGWAAGWQELCPLMVQFGSVTYFQRLHDKVNVNATKMHSTNMCKPGYPRNVLP